MLVSAIAGVCNVLSTCPLWVANTRIKAGLVSARAGLEDSEAGFLEAILVIYRAEGLRGLWAGTLPSLMLVSNPIIQHTTYEQLKNVALANHPEDALRVLRGREAFVFGAIAKAFSTVVTYPLQLAQARMRAGKGGKAGDDEAQEGEGSFLAAWNTLLRSFAGVAHVLINTVAKHGVKGLYQGLGAKLASTVLASCLHFLTYEKLFNVFAVLMLAKRRKIKIK